MKKFENRKLFLIFTAFVAVFSVYSLTDIFKGSKILLILFPTAAFCVVAVCGFNSLFRRRTVIFAIVILLSLLLSLLFAMVVSNKRSRAALYSDEKEHFSRAVVSEVLYTGEYSSSYYADVFEVDGEEVDFRVLLEADGNRYFEYGEVIKFEASFIKADVNTSYLHSKGIFLTAVTENAESENYVRKNLIYHIHRANVYLSDRFLSFLGETAGGICSALVLGNKNLVSPEVKLSFSRAGISHILALSGLHLSVIASSLDFILRGFVGKRTRNIILIAVCALFSVFTGFSSSVVRAAVMFIFICAADIAGERSDPLTSLSAAAFFIILFNPNAVYDVGFWLSIFATLGIITVGAMSGKFFDRFERPRKNRVKCAAYDIFKYFYGVFVTSLSALVFTLPITYFTFGEISIAGPLSNFIFIPAIGILIPLAVLFLPLSYIPYISSLLAFVIQVLSSIIFSLAGKISDMNGIYVSLKYPFSDFFAAVLIALLIVAVMKNRLSAKKSLAVLSVFLVLFISFAAVYGHITDGNMDIIVEGGEGDDFIIVKADGKGYAVDISGGKYSFMYESIFSAKELSLTEIDTLFITHYQRYAKNSVEYISERIKIRKVLLPYPENESEKTLFNSMKSSFEKIGIEVFVYRRGEKYIDGNISFDFSERLLLSRSERPLVACSVEYSRDDDVFSFSYIESAALESAFDYNNFIDKDVVFIGSHGAERKFRASLSEIPCYTRLIFPDAEEAEFFRDFSHVENIYCLSDYENRKIHILYSNLDIK